MTEKATGRRDPLKHSAAKRGLYALVVAGLLASIASPRDLLAGWPWKWTRKAAACGHPGCGPDHCIAAAGWAGDWYWMGSPEIEQCVATSLFNRFCIRCHGIDGRGVWDVPDVPDFTDPRWQSSRSDQEIVNNVLRGRGTVMPRFRRTLHLEEAWAIARYLRTFAPASEVLRPEVGRTPDARPRNELPEKPTGTAAPTRSTTPPR